MVELLKLVMRSKAYIGGAALILLALGKIFIIVGECLTEVHPLTECFAQLNTAWDALVAAALGLSTIGLRHGQQKAQVATEKAITASVQE